MSVRARIMHALKATINAEVADSPKNRETAEAAIEALCGITATCYLAAHEGGIDNIGSCTQYLLDALHAFKERN